MEPFLGPLKVLSLGGRNWNRNGCLNKNSLVQELHLVGGSAELVTVQQDCLQTNAPCLLPLKPTTLYQTPDKDYEWYLKDALGCYNGALPTR